MKTGVSEGQLYETTKSMQNISTDQSFEKKVLSDVSDKSFTITSSAYAIGTLIGPILGGVLYDMSDFTKTTLFFAALGFVLCMALAIVAFATR